MSEQNPVADVAKAGAAAGGAWGIALMIFGMLCIAAPFVAGTFASIMIAISLIGSGLVITLGAMRANSWGMGIFGVLMGVVTALAGVYMVAHPVLGLVTITLALAIYFIVDGIVEIIGSLQARPAEGWGWFLVGGIISFLLGYMIYSEWPFSGAWAVGTLVGIRLLFGGMAMMIVVGASAAAPRATDQG